MKHLVILHIEKIMVLNNFANTIFKNEKPENNTLVFDGDCSFCQRCTSILHTLDKQHRIKLVSYNTQDNTNNIQENASTEAFNSVIFYHQGKFYTESDAVIESLVATGGWCRIFILAKIIPLFLRNKLYRFVARNRYLFGSTCHVK